MENLCATVAMMCTLFYPSLDADKLNFANSIAHCGATHNLTLPPEERIPLYLVVGVAAHESGYGSSRISQEANNYFGMKTLNKEYYIVPENNPDVKLALYFSMCDSVEDFMDLLLNYYAYEDFRNELDLQRKVGEIDYSKLVNTLSAYAVDEEWTDKVIKIINQINRRFI